MSYQFYHIIHLVGLILLVSSLSAAWFLSVNAITRETNSARKLMLAMHGLGWLALFVSGFGLLARLGLMNFPIWVLVKLGVLLFLGFAVVPLQKSGSKLVAVGVLLAVFLALSMVVFKP